jgi:hypothetical protein
MENTMNRYLATAVLSLTTLLSATLQAEISLTAFSREEALHERNISKPRIVIKNTGTRPVHGFSFLYYINAENGFNPIIDNYYTPGAQISLEYYGRGSYAVRYDVPGVTLYPGESYPNESGCVFGIHYPGWEPFFKNNDQSCNFSEMLVQNPEITIYSAGGYVASESVYRVISSRKECPGNKEPSIHRTVAVDISLEYPGRKPGRTHQ